MFNTLFEKTASDGKIYTVRRCGFCVIIFWTRQKTQEVKRLKKLLCFLYTGIMLVMFSFVCGAADSAGKVVTDGGNLNVRSSPSSSSGIITSLKNSTWVTLQEKSGSWYKAEYADGKTGWLHGDYLRTYPTTYEMTVAVSSGQLNVRSGAGTSYPVTDKLSKGDSVVILYGNSRWSRILYSGNKIGYCSTAYLKSPEESKYTPVSLAVPSYKQTDPRWKNHPIGSYGDTVGTIGCTTTALAMTESYHTGATVTPVMMASRLSYSASGSLYWPSYYQVELADGDYLSTVYKLLSQGKPVVFGAKKASGSQHWVTVTGYTGSSDSLSASYFTVNDPGSDKRTRLSEFMAVYPYAYKIVYRK